MQGPSVPILIFFLAFCLLVGKYRRWFSHWNVRHGDRSQIFSMCSSPTICNCTSRYKWQWNFLQQNPWKLRNLSRWKFISTTRFETSCWFKKYVDLLCYAKVPIRKIVSIVYSENLKKIPIRTLFFQIFALHFIISILLNWFNVIHSKTMLSDLNLGQQNALKRQKYRFRKL